MMRVLFVVFLISASYLGFSQEGEVCTKPWIFFDLGNTIVDTKTNNYKPMFYMRDVAQKNADGSYVYEDGQLYKNAKDYIDALHLAGYPLGMVIDIPERWGQPYPLDNPVSDVNTAKTLRLMDFIKGVYPDEATWLDVEGETTLLMDWSLFGSFSGEGSEKKFNGSLVLPQKNSERKSEGSTILFERALSLAKSQNTCAIYMGEDQAELELASSVGIFTYRVGSGKSFYLSVDEIESFVK